MLFDEDMIELYHQQQKASFAWFAVIWEVFDCDPLFTVNFNCGDLVNSIVPSFLLIVHL